MPIKLVVNAAPSAVENPDGGSVWKKKFSLISYSAVAGGRELVELCPAVMPALNTSNGVMLTLGRPTAAKITGCFKRLGKEKYTAAIMAQRCRSAYRSKWKMVSVSGLIFTLMTLLNKII